MTIKLTEAFKLELMQGLGTETVNGQHYLVYDSIRLGKVGDNFVVALVRKNKDIAYMDVPFPDFEGGSTVTLAGVEGRMEVSVS